MWFFLNLYLQQVLHYGAFASGAALLPMTATIMVLMVAIAPRVMARTGAKPPTVAGLLLLGAGLAWMAAIRPHGSFAGGAILVAVTLRRPPSASQAATGKPDIEPRVP